MNNNSLEICNILSRNLKEQRKRSGYSQEKLAEITGLSVQTINDIEGCRKWVSAKTISKLSTALQIECFQLLVPEATNQNKKNVNPTKYMLELMKKLKKNINSQINSEIEEQFTEFLKLKMYR